MRVLFDDQVYVHYGQISVAGDDIDTDDGFRAGQANGLCGAGKPGLLFLVTGRHTGNVPFRVELHESEPPVPEEWEDVVEASFRPASQDVALVEWAGEEWYPLDLDLVDLRVRYCCHGMDEARGDAESPNERYLLQFWPAPSAPDAIVRQTSETAAYWHAIAQDSRDW